MVTCPDFLGDFFAMNILTLNMDTVHLTDEQFYQLYLRGIKSCNLN
ncbi:hypothetical protein [Leptothermofonsia sp. ETS-13]